MTTIEFLERQYNHAFDMVKFGETKNTTLIAFNGAVIVGMSKLAGDTSVEYLRYYLLYIILMCGISIFISFSALIAKIKHTTNNISTFRSDNMLFFSSIAQYTPDELVEKLKNHYACVAANHKHEQDIARQAIITSQIASRKYKLFNVAIAFTFAGIATPVSIIIYKLFLDNDK